MILNWINYLVCMFTLVHAADKGSPVGCFKKTLHEFTVSLNFAKNCFDLCESKFFRYSVLYDEKCSCENILKENEEEGQKCTQICQYEEQNISCGSDENESIFETGSVLPGPVRNLKLQEITEDRITIEFDPPERNGTELSGYEIKAYVIQSFSNNLWIMNQTWKMMKSRQHKFDCSNLLSSTKYKILITAKNGELDGGETSVEGLTRLKVPSPKPDSPLIISQSDKTATIKIMRYKTNNNGPITKYLIVVSLMENDFVKNDFNELLLTTYEKAKDEGISYYIAAEIDPFQEETKIFTIGDNQMYGKYFNAPLPTNNLHVLIGILSRLNDEEKTSFSNISHERIAEIFHSESSSSNNYLIFLLTIACILCGLILFGSVVFYAYIRIMRINLRNSRFERHELQVQNMQGPILEVDNNGFISCDFDVSGVSFKEKLEEVLTHLEPDQKIARKNLSLDIDAILGIGSFGDVIKGQLNSQNLVHQNENQSRCKLTQVHVVSADDMDQLVQIKFLRELQNLLQFGYDKYNLLQFFGICKTHDWIFIVCEDTPENLKQFLVSHRATDQNHASRLSSFGEEHALRLMLQLASAMEFLKYNKVVHKNLNSNNIRVKRQNSTLPSLSLSIFGPTLYKISEDGSKNMIDDERWFSLESFRFQKFSHASDVYSCALAIWEIATIGATPYQIIPTRDLFVKIKKGIRPEKCSFISEDLYQLLLNCWELDPTERLDFTDIAGQLKNFLHSPHYYLNYTLEGPLPFYLPSIEIKN